ncbi:Protein disulfide-isomerase A3 [Balamuthia mandrillaris]
MKKVSVLISVLVALFIASASFADQEEAVITLTKDNFDEVVNNQDIILVEFYAPWCGHCKKLAPEYEKAAQTLKNNDPPIPLAKVDATEERELGDRYGVTGYPTLKVFRKGAEPAPYTGGRTEDAIVNYMKKQAGPASKVLDTKEAFDKFVASNVPAVVAFYSEGSSGLNTFTSVANANREDFSFAQVTDSSLAATLGHSNAVVVYKKDEDAAVYSEDGSTDALLKWLRVNSLPLADEITARNADKYQKSGLPLLRFYFDVDHTVNVKQTAYYVRRLAKVAQIFVGKVVAGYSALNMASDYAQPNDKVVVLVEKNDLKYKFTGEFGIESVKNFVQDVLDGKVKPAIKSEPIPESNDGPVTVVVGENFDQIVTPEKDILIEFYAPWCGHCKSLAPKYDQLGEKLKDISTLTIAKIDATANDWPRSKFPVSGFPTIFFVPAGGEPISYNGNREVDDFVTFIKKHATHKF